MLFPHNLVIADGDGVFYQHWLWFLGEGVQGHGGEIYREIEHLSAEFYHFGGVAVPIEEEYRFGILFVVFVRFQLQPHKPLVESVVAFLYDYEHPPTTFLRIYRT